ncbi:MFS transporter [Acidilutibacter cellobiosedens]|jgi:MFS family permease|uniref:MFS transporter n=1 Tax=Acidilutibacter cellobiosedens TaxID=2507161 RepID=A0A410QH70_9FIRM|nr:MFS transporter [Acidilutibacter cellobiosedens]QAT63194.1 MFS transporter [Acidilutibacter cellobiosedens]
MWNVILLGLVSFFSDISAEMVYPIIPLYLTSVFGATPALVGVIEGIAESLASLLKVFSGYVTDKYHNKKPVAFIGYATGLIYKVALIFANSWVGILGARAIDRIGKGIRTAPRDVMVSESADKEQMGKAFGIHKALDMAGSSIGIFISFLLLKNAGENFAYKKLFAISTIPAFLGLIMFFFIKEKNEHSAVLRRKPFWQNIKQLDRKLKLYIMVAFLFTLGNSSNTFLLLRAKSVGFDDTSVILLYFIFNLTASILSIPLGKLSDKIGRKKLLVSGYFVFSSVYLGFAFASSQSVIVIVFVLYGIYTAMITGVERAFIAEISPEELKGTMLGMHSTVVGIALLPASVIAGLLWNGFGASVPFLFGSGMSLLAALILLFFM